MKHNYSQITQQYMSANQLDKYKLTETTGRERTVLLTRDQFKEWRSRGVPVKP